MSLKESIAIALSFIILLVGSFAGRDFSDRTDVFEGFFDDKSLSWILHCGYFLG